jgi:ABC-type transport system involved in cytochrome c biogenesis permease component
LSGETQPINSDNWLNRVTDWFNPILVKEARQSLKSRGFVMTFMLMLIACWIVSFYYTMIEAADLEFGTGGRDIFQWYYGVLCFAVLIAVPFGAYRSLLAEREETTFDLLSITTLKPRQIVWGKLSSALLQTMIYYAAITPFIAFTSLLQGMDLLQGTFLLGLVMLASVIMSMACLASGAMTKQKVWQIFATLAMLFGLFMVAIWFITVVPMMFYSPSFDLRDSTFWYIMGTVVVWALSYFFLMQQISTALLTFAADNRSTGVRVVCTLQFFLLWGGMAIIYWQGTARGAPPTPEPFIAALLISLTHWAVVGLFVTTEWDELSPRLSNRLPKSIIWRALLIPWLPGGARGLMYVIGNIALMVPITWFCLRHFSLLADFSFQLVGGVCAYLLIFLGFCSFLGRMLMNLSHELRPAHSRVLAVITLALFMIVPHLIDIATSDRYGQTGYSMLFITDPVRTLDFLMGDTTARATRVLIILWSLAIVGVGLNVLPMVRGIREILLPQRYESASS